MSVPDIAAGMSISTALQKLSWDVKLQDESSTQDIFSDNAGIYDDETKQVPDAVMMTVKSETGNKTKMLAMLNRLDDAGQQGAGGELRGNEEPQVTRELRIYANEVYHGVPTEAYGLTKVGQDPYAIYGKAQPQLSLWNREKKGKMIRQALCERVDSAQSDTVATYFGLEQQARQHPNIYAPGCTGTPTYDATPGDYDEIIGDYLTAGTCKMATVAALNKIEELAATEWEIEPITINGKPTWILVLPTRQKAALRTPGTGTLIELLKDGDVRGENNKALRGVFGRYGSLLLMEDPRNPIMDLGGSNSSWTQTYSYKGMGQADGRTLTAAAGTKFDVGFVLGKAAVIDFEVEAEHIEREVQKYGRKVGIGTFMTRGYTRPDWELAVGTPADTARNQSSAVVLFSSADET